IDVNSTFFLPIYKQHPLGAIKEILELRPQRYDYSLLAFPAFRREYHIVQRLIGAKKRIAHKFSKGYVNECNFLDTDHIPVDDTVHNVVNNLNLLHTFGIKWQNTYQVKDLQYDLLLDTQDIQFGKQYIQN